MNIHEYQAKNILASYQLPVPEGYIAFSVAEATAAFKKLNLPRAVVKAQIHAGGRGKAGGVKIVNNTEELEDMVHQLLGKRLVTYQTDEKGQPVERFLIEQPSDIERELYLGMVIDRTTRRVGIIASTEGGVEIEKVAEKTPEKIHHLSIDPLMGVLPYQARELGFLLNLNPAQIKEFTHILVQLGKLFVEKDLSLLEINPLVVTKDGHLLCLDAKVNLDENALFRQPELLNLRDVSQEDDRENRARDWELSYIALEGNIGCMVNGAGLAMATMDLVKLHGGEPANFLDVGGGATQERVTEAFKIILSDEKVKGVLVNIFGGIVRCDLIADGIINAVAQVGIQVPVVVRLEGNNATLAAEKLSKSGLNIIAAQGLDDAASKIVKAVNSLN